MDHITSTPQEKPHAHDDAPGSRQYTLRIPKPNWQVTALIIIAVIAGFQTFQLARLKGQVTPKASVAGTTATPDPSASAGSASGLQSQVGGC